MTNTMGCSMALCYGDLMEAPIIYIEVNWSIDPLHFDFEPHLKGKIHTLLSSWHRWHSTEILRAMLWMTKLFYRSPYPSLEWLPAILILILFFVQIQVELKLYTTILNDHRGNEPKKKIPGQIFTSITKFLPKHLDTCRYSVICVSPQLYCHGAGVLRTPIQSDLLHQVHRHPELVQMHQAQVSSTSCVVFRSTLFLLSLL